jgi:hypothetical protein
MCVYMYSRFVENHPIWILEDGPLISEGGSVTNTHTHTYIYIYIGKLVSGLALNTVPDGHHILHVRATCLLVVIIIVIVGSGYYPLRASLLPLLTALVALLGTLDSDAGWRHFAAARDHFPTTWDEGRPDRLLASGLLGDDAKELLGGVPDDIV